MGTNFTNNEYSKIDVFHSYWRDYPDLNDTGGAYWHPHWRQWPPVSELVHILSGVLMTLVFILATAGNGTVIYLFLRNKRLQTAANMYVANLSCADMIMCLVNFPILVWASFSREWALGDVGCKVYGTIGAFTGFLSMNTLTAMAIDRYQIIYLKNVLIRHASKSNHWITIIFIWIYSIIWSLLPVFGWGRYALNGGKNSCCFDYISRDLSNIAFIGCLFVFCFFIQISVIMYCYLKMLVFVCRHERQFQEHNDNGSDRRIGKRFNLELKVTRIVFIIVSTFCVSWLPFAVVALIGAFGDQSVITPATSVIPGLLAKTSTAVNPILYAISHPTFREKIALTCPFMCPNLKRRPGTTGLSSIYHATAPKTSSGAIPRYM